MIKTTQLKKINNGHMGNKWACRNIREIGNGVDAGGRGENPLKSSV